MALLRMVVEYEESICEIPEVTEGLIADERDQWILDGL